MEIAITARRIKPLEKVFMRHLLLIVFRLKKAPIYAYCVLEKRNPLPGSEASSSLIKNYGYRRFHSFLTGCKGGRCDNELSL
jgi:hypothetical protein